MEFSNLPPRVEPAALSGDVASKQPQNALSTAAETARPVLAAEAAADTTASKNDGFHPLDTFEVGDNDYVPVPPEPPRKATVLAVMADAPLLEPVEAAPSPEPLVEALRDIDTGPVNPTVDIRR